MTEVLNSPSSSSSSSSSSSTLFHSVNNQEPEGVSKVTNDDDNNNNNDDEDDVLKNRENRDTHQLSLLAFLLALFRKSFWVGSDSEVTEENGMEIGWPTDVRHVAHVTFDRFNGFLGLPDEFEPQVPTRAPSASATVFGVSTESMQLSYDSRGNSIPVIIMLMQQCLYNQGGLQAEGIFRINADNDQEEQLRNQLNNGVVPDSIDVHCLAGLIKAWFRELPTGILDPLSPEQVMQCQSEDDYIALCRLLPPTETALLDWAINLMADVVQHEHLNKMNSHNIAMVFAPNMTQMADPLNALMYAVKVMNFLKTLILKTLRERQNSVIESSQALQKELLTDENNDQGPELNPQMLQNLNGNEDDHLGQVTVTEESDEPKLCIRPVESLPPIEPKTHTDAVNHAHNLKAVAKSSDIEKIEPVALVTDTSSISSQTEKEALH